MKEQEWFKELLDKLMTAKPSLWLEEQRKAGILKKYLPELDSCYGITQNQYHKYDVYYHLLYSCDAAAPKEVLRLAALLHDIGKPAEKQCLGEKVVFYNHEITSASLAYSILTRFQYPESRKKKITLLIRHHMFHYRENWTDSAIRRLFKKVGAENLEDLFLLRIADREGNGTRKGEPEKVKELRGHIKRVIEAEKRFKIKDLAIGGKDVMQLGVTFGPEIGKVLKQLFELVVSGSLPNEKDVLMAAGKKIVYK